VDQKNRDGVSNPEKEWGSLMQFSGAFNPGKQ
jgi:hypothetical protein